MVRWLQGACRPAAALVAAILPVWPMVATAQDRPASAVGIYTCIDDRGRKLTADRPIAECSSRNQHLLNRDGSLRTVLPPTLTPEERADKEARDRAAAEQRALQADAVRRDRNLMVRYPTEASHQRAREAALDTVRLAIRTTDLRLKELAVERKPLRDEAEFYQGKQLPAKLRSAIDANDAAVDAQRQAATSQVAELERISKLYDAELDRLRRLWAGAPAGSMGVLPAVAPAAVAAPAAPTAARNGNRSGPQR